MLWTYFQGLQLSVQLHHLLIQTEVIHRKRADVLRAARRRKQTIKTNTQTNGGIQISGLTSAERVTVPSSLIGASPMLLSSFGRVRKPYLGMCVYAQPSDNSTHERGRQRPNLSFYSSARKRLAEFAHRRNVGIRPPVNGMKKTNKKTREIKRKFSPGSEMASQGSQGSLQPPSAPSSSAVSPLGRGSAPEVAVTFTCSRCAAGCGPGRGSAGRGGAVFSRLPCSSSSSCIGTLFPDIPAC